jgi:hypothetical protein
MWIARTSKYTYTLLPNGQFSKSDLLGSVQILSNCITAPKDNFIVMLPGLDDFGNEIICLIRMPGMYAARRMITSVRCIA